jgi:hypothetical protein
MHIFVLKSEFITDLVGTTNNPLGPPSAHIKDASEYFFPSLVYRKGGGEILFIQVPLYFLDLNLSSGCVRERPTLRQCA